MTLLAWEAQESWLPTVTGLACSETLLEGALLQLRFGEQRSISLYGVWRIEQADQVIAGSGDTDQRATSEALRRLAGTTLEETSVSHPGFDLELRFTAGIIIRCFPSDAARFGTEFPENDDDPPVNWWVEGEGVPEDWEVVRGA